MQGHVLSSLSHKYKARHVDAPSFASEDAEVRGVTPLSQYCCACLTEQSGAFSDSYCHPPAPAFLRPPPASLEPSPPRLCGVLPLLSSSLGVPSGHAHRLPPSCSLFLEVSSSGLLLASLSIAAQTLPAASLLWPHPMY